MPMLPTHAKKDKFGKMSCNCCGTPSNLALGCTVVLYDFCEHVDHASVDCPLHQALKPQLLIYGLVDEELISLIYLSRDPISLRWRILILVGSQLRVEL
jgi:hypothetical protein